MARFFAKILTVNDDLNEYKLAGEDVARDAATIKPRLDLTLEDKLNDWLRTANYNHIIAAHYTERNILLIYD